MLKHDRRELEREHRGVEHHAIRHFKHYRVRIAHDERVPYVVRLAEVVHQRRAYENVSEKRCKNRGPDDRMQPLDVKDVYRGGERKAACRQHHAAKDVEADPDTPRKLIGEVSRSAETLRT